MAFSKYDNLCGVVSPGSDSTAQKEKTLCICISFSALSVQCKRLQSLLIQRCHRITERSLAPLRQRVLIDRPRPRQDAHNVYNLNDFYPSDFLVY